MPVHAQAVSSLEDVIGLLQTVFSYLGDGTPIMIGDAYLNEPGPGSAPRVVFVPEEGGKFGPAQKMNAGYSASWAHACKVYVRGAESGADRGRFASAVALAARVCDVLKNLDPGHVILAPGNPKNDSPLPAGGPGADIVFEFSYVANIANDPAVLRAIAAAITSVSPPDVDRPGGDSGKSFVVTASAVADRS